MNKPTHLTSVDMKAETPRVLIVEDDTEIARLVKINLEDQGYEVDQIYDGTEGYRQIREQPYDLIILDLMLPGMDGLEICKKIRAEDYDIPMLMLTAKSEEFDKVLGLELGADDYVTKPFGLRELMARVKALLRRSKQPAESGGKTGDQEKIQFGDITIEPSKHKVQIGEQSIDLTEKEFKLLHLFMQNPGKAFSRDELLNEVWGYQFGGYEHTVNTHINRLRSKIEQQPSDPKYLKTVWGVGYRFIEEEEIE